MPSVGPAEQHLLPEKAQIIALAGNARRGVPFGFVREKPASRHHSVL
jgi:hypothetical protein